MPGKLAIHPHRSQLLHKYPADIPVTALGRREEGFCGVTGETITWRDILHMWFHYCKPVSGKGERWESGV